MPNEPAEPVQVEFTQEFKRNLRALAKKYRHIRSDVQPVVDQLQAGEVVGDQVPGTHYTLFKCGCETVISRKANVPAIA